MNEETGRTTMERPTTGMTPRVAQPDRYFAVESEELIRRGEVDEAIEHCRRGLIFYPENISAYAVLANAYLLLNENERAVNVLLDGHRRTGASQLRDLAEALTPGAEGPTEEPAFEESPYQGVEVEESPAETDDSDETDTSFTMDDPLHIADIVPGFADIGSEKEIVEVELEDETEESEEHLVNLDESLFGDEVRPMTHDLFTGEPLDENAFSFKEEEEVIGLEEERREEEPEHIAQIEYLIEPESPSIFADTPEEEPVAEEPVEEIVEPELPEPTSTDDDPTTPLSLHSGTPISKLRSRNLRLIPGLEYAPLRKDDSSPKVAPLLDDRKRKSPVDLPPPPTEKPKRVAAKKKEEVPIEKVGTPRPVDAESMTPLEELARRLESARIPAVEEQVEESEETPTFAPSLVSDTFAAILVSQGAYTEAIKAYQTLAELKPARREEYERKVQEIEGKRE